MNNVFVFYRYPHKDKYTCMRQTCGQPLAVRSFEELNGKSGFVFAPFRMSSGNPLLVLQPDIVESRAVNGDVSFDESAFKNRDIQGERNSYCMAFTRFHKMLANGRFSKIVLSRRSTEMTDEVVEPETLFMRACNLYPRMFIALVSMPQCGTWLMATPEILLESKNSKWHTMAVAGTMRIDGDGDNDASLAMRKNEGDISEWDKKNIREQRYVSEYIRECLSKFSDNVDEKGPYTLRAGMVKHLATDFEFGINGGKSLGELLGVLHPTPAVCGMPKADTYSFIHANEGYDRKYYSGFVGPLRCAEGTHLYVTLRCMQVNGGKFSLYAGGGLLDSSDEQTEWTESEIKMETMRKCLAIRKM